MPLVHQELRQIARRCLAGEHKGHSYQATALVNEAYLRLVDAASVDWQNRTHFLAVAARIMRRILVDHARARLSQKRGGRTVEVTFEDALEVADEPRHDFEALDDALKRSHKVMNARLASSNSASSAASLLKKQRRC